MSTLEETVCDSVNGSIWNSVRRAAEMSLSAFVCLSVRDAVSDSVENSVKTSVWHSVYDYIWYSVYDSVSERY